MGHPFPPPTVPHPTVCVYTCVCVNPFPQRSVPDVLHPKDIPGARRAHGGGDAHVLSLPCISFAARGCALSKVRRIKGAAQKNCIDRPPPQADIPTHTHTHTSQPHQSTDQSHRERMSTCLGVDDGGLGLAVGEPGLGHVGGAGGGVPFLGGRCRGGLWGVGDASGGCGMAWPDVCVCMCAQPVVAMV